MNISRKYEDLKDTAKLKRRYPSLYEYLMTNHVFNPEKPFHTLTKEELIAEYEKLVKKHADVLKEL